MPNKSLNGLGFFHCDLVDCLFEIRMQEQKDVVIQQRVVQRGYPPILLDLWMFGGTTTLYQLKIIVDPHRCGTSHEFGLNHKCQGAHNATPPRNLFIIPYNPLFLGFGGDSLNCHGSSSSSSSGSSSSSSGSSSRRRRTCKSLLANTCHLVGLPSVDLTKTCVLMLVGYAS